MKATVKRTIWKEVPAYTVYDGQNRWLANRGKEEAEALAKQIGGRVEVGKRFEFDREEAVEVKVGDYVGFKCDIEQTGKITKIENHYGRVSFHLHNPDGFSGDYLRYATDTIQDADRCWWIEGGSK